MGTQIGSILFCCSTVVTAAQGQLNMANFDRGVNAPITDAFGNRIIAQSPYVADLFWSVDTNATMDSLAPAGVNTKFTASIPNYGNGYFYGGPITFPFCCFPILAQVRVWNTNYGSTYYEARDNGGDFGFSNLIRVFPDAPPGTPSPLSGLESFQLQRLPTVYASPTSTNTVIFLWPTNIANYALQENNGFDASNWTQVQEVPMVVGSQNQSKSSQTSVEHVLSVNIPMIIKLNYPTATNPAMTAACHAEAALRRFVDWSRWAERTHI